MTYAKHLMTRTHKGGTEDVAIATSRMPTAEDEAQRVLQQVRMANSRCESV